MHTLALWLAHGGYVLLLCLQAALLIGLTAWRLRELRSRPWMPRVADAGTPTVGTKAWWRAAVSWGLLVAGVAALLRFSLPASPQVVYDELWYLSTARHMRASFDATPFVVRDESGVAPAGDEFRPPYPQGWPWLETPIAGGTGAWTRAVTLERVVGVAACVALYATFAAESLGAATYMGLGLAILPAFVRLGQGASAEGASTLFVILALWAARSQRGRPGPAGALLTLTSLAWALQFRPENLLYLPLFLPVAFVRTGRESDAEAPADEPTTAPDTRENTVHGLATTPEVAEDTAPIESGRFGSGLSAAGWTVGLALFALFVSADLAIMADGAAGPHAADHFVAQPRPGFTTWQANMVANLRENGLFFFDGRVLPRWVTAAAAVGGMMIARTGGFVPVAWFLGWIGLFTLALSPYPFGDFPAAHSADTWRFSVAVSLPLLMLGGRGVEWTARLLGRGRTLLTTAVLGVWMALSVGGYWDFVTGPNPREATWRDLAQVAERVDGPVWVSDDSVAVALQEGFGLTVVWPRTGVVAPSHARPCWMLAVGDDLPAAWADLPLDLKWTTGPVEAGREGLTLYQLR